MVRVYCRKCREDMVAGYLEGHSMTHHRQAAEERQIWKTSPTGKCPVEGCPGQAGTRTAMRVHFLYQHFLYTVFILEEGNLPQPRCPRCNMMFS